MNPVLTLEQSLSLHQRLVMATLSAVSVSDTRCQSVAGNAQYGWDYQLWFGESMDFEGQLDWLKGAGSSVDFKRALKVQQGASLGERMANCFRALLERYRQVILVGSDCPYLGGEHLKQVIDCGRQGKNVVLVPAEDGGYALVALTQLCEAIFVDMPWGTDRVLDITVERLRRLNEPYELLQPLHDVDRPEDLVRLIESSIGREVLGQPLYDELNERLHGSAELQD